MKILIISHFFPPFNTAGAVRIGKLAKYLVAMGHEVRVLSSDNQPWMPTLPVEIDEKHIIRTPWFNINKPIQFLLGGKKSIAAKGFERAGRLPSIITKIGYYYKDFFNFPDGQIGWYPYALRACKKLLKEWTPDYIFSSSSPPTSFLIAKKLSKLYQIPWVADLRDLWADNHNSDLYNSALRRLLDHKMEKWVLSTAKALITVSEPLANILRQKYDKPIEVISNGYDLEDYPKLDNVSRDPIVKIVYTGLIHPTKRDPAPVFKAVSLLQQDSSKIKIDFYGINNAIVKKTATNHAIANIVNCYDTVPYYESLNLQVNADILLLLTHNSDREKGVITAKFFEYLGARRPILLVGCVNGVAANIINDRKVGLASNEPEKIADFLKAYIKDKQNKKSQQLSLQAIQGFSRQEQVIKLIAFLEKIKE